MKSATETFAPGMTVRITQQLPHGTQAVSAEVSGAVISFEQAKTGSWFAHSRDDKLWLDRLTIRKDDGEIVVVNLDRYTHVDILGPSLAAGA